MPLISQLLDWAYAGFAHNRLRLTGRCTAKSCATNADLVPLCTPEKKST